MSRKKRVYKRRKQTSGDSVHNDEVIAKLICKMMYGGKKSLAEKIVYGALDEVQKKVSGEKPLQVLKKAVDNLKPALEVRSRRVGGATYQVPVEVRPLRKLSLSLRWLTEHSRQRKEKTMKSRLAGEILDAYNSKGNAYKKREDVHRMAEANKAFSHYNW